MNGRRYPPDVRFRLLPTDDKFFPLFDQAASNASECARRLRNVVADPAAGGHDRINECERQGDEITRTILQRLNSTFVTPFDREDIHALAESFDDVVDDIQTVWQAMLLTHLTDPLPEMAEQADLLVRMAEEAEALINQLESMKGVQRPPRRHRCPGERRRHGVPADPQPPLQRRAGSHRGAAPQGHRRGPRRRHEHHRGHLGRRRVDRPEARLNLTRGRRRTGLRDPGHAGLRLRQRLPRRRQLDRHRGADPRAVTAPGGAVGHGVRLHRLPLLRHPRGQHDRQRRGDAGRAHHRRDLRRAGGCDRVGPRHLLPRAPQRPHALVGGIAGRPSPVGGFDVLVSEGIRKIALFIVLSPLIGLAVGLIITVGIAWLFHGVRRLDVLNKGFRHGQQVSAAAFSLGHGANDAQKTMGIILALLIAADHLPANADVPLWVVLSAHTAIGLGTLTGGWRIVKTMARRSPVSNPRGGWPLNRPLPATLFATSAGRASRSPPPTPSPAPSSASAPRAGSPPCDGAWPAGSCGPGCSRSPEPSPSPSWHRCS